MSAKIKVMLADDHLLVMEGFRDLLNKAQNIEIVGEATDGEQAVFVAINRKPDVVLMDINMPLVDGITATKRILKANKNIKVLMLSMHHEERYIILSDQAGASGYLLKNIDKEELLHAIEQVATGKRYFSKAIPEALVQKVISRKYENTGPYNNQLTTREVEILKEISRGLTNKEIGDKLFISDRTVNAHRTNIMAKLQAKNAVELVVKALDMKII